MNWIELFLIATGLSMDAFAVSICKGLAMKRCTLGKAGIVGLYFGGFQALMPLIGYFLGVQFRDVITSVDHWIAFILLGVIGGRKRVRRRTPPWMCETCWPWRLPPASTLWRWA